MIPALLRHRLHDSKHGAAIEVLDRKEDAMGVGIYRYAVGTFCQLPLASLRQFLAVLLKDADHAAFACDVD